ncbi:MAG: DUF4338 domain-containing protein, partial [Verrucomicrobia bacterium]|nr:DUF4338 domain-containing protein [Verrucomicrobiota bacterium]
MLAVLVFGAAAWKCAARDLWIGWTPDQRQARLSWVANNHRFLILPAVNVRHLASHILGRVARRIAPDWRAKYACRCGCGGVLVAPLPPRLLPQSKLGLGLAVYLLLARFDD